MQHARSYWSHRLLRFNVSTAFLLIALVELPVAAWWVKVPLSLEGGPASWLLPWLLYDFIPSFFIVAFVAAGITGIVAAVQRRWRRIPQLCAEMVICVLAVFNLPAY
ncbi:hypothetical protein [Variovorax paradoxus]|uniref:hypothetical protein n=1 Tax=Variovorax paradoxus TaxID=34073 RepID=UPI00339A0A26